MDDQSGGRGLKRAGNLQLPTGTSPYSSDLNRRPWRESSETTGSRSLALRVSSSIGRQLSGIAVGKSLSIAEAAAKGDPAEVDRAILASLPHSIASTLQPMYRDFIDPKYGFDSEFLGYALRGDVPAGDLMLARQMVGQHLRPGDEAHIKREIARLRVSTKSRAESDDDMAMGFQVIAEECAEYPPDVVQWALRGWARSEVFYPSLAEIRERLQRGARRRKAMLAALSANAAEPRRYPDQPAQGDE